MEQTLVSEIAGDRIVGRRVTLNRWDGPAQNGTVTGTHYDGFYSGTAMAWWVSVEWDDGMCTRNPIGEIRPASEPTPETYPANQSGPVRSMRVGDIVHAHGLLCLVTDAPTRSFDHAGPSGDRHGGCWSTRARVLNVETGTAPHTAVPRSWVTDTGGAWTLQGNDLGRFNWHRPA